MRKIEFAPQAIEDLKKYKQNNKNLAFKVFDLISDIHQNASPELVNQNLLKETIKENGLGE